MSKTKSKRPRGSRHSRICSGGHFGRRQFIRVGSLGFLGINLSQYYSLKEALASSLDHRAKAQACILVWLDGGPSQVDTWDPKPNSFFKPMTTNISGVQISELFPRLAGQMDKLSIIRSMHTEERNHPQGTHYAVTGHRPSTAMKFPCFGAVVAKEMGARNNLPPHVLVPEMRPIQKRYEDYFKGHFIGAEYDPMILPDPSAEDFNVPDLTLPESITEEVLADRRSFLEVVDQTSRRKVETAEFSQMDTFVEQALNLILSPAVRNAFDLSQETDRLREAYGRDSAGQSLLLARRLVEAGSRFVTASGSGHKSWDTHVNNDKAHREHLAPTLDRSLSVLLADLEQRGLLESTVVMVMGEFGRTVHLNPAGGRDHWTECWSLLIGGGGIRGGQIVGASDERGAYPAERIVSIGDLFATVYKALGIDWKKEYVHPIGRPVKIANALGDQTGQPISELI